MERHVRDYILWILCVDDQTHDFIEKLSLPNVRLLKLSALETDELIAVKKLRTIGEYCWTLTPFAPRFVFESDVSVERVTYIDADVWFRKHPKPIFDELSDSGKSVLITDHAYAPEYDQTSTSGQFCVQFVTFKRESGEIVRKWWEDRCIEWCYARFENGKFGDQKYLDDWPERFEPLVHVLKDKELILAPWNAIRFPYGRSIIWHFHGFKVINATKFNTHYFYKIPSICKTEIYNKYCGDVAECIVILEKNFQINIKAIRQVSHLRNFLRRIKLLIHKI